MAPNEFSNFLKSIGPKPLHVLDAAIPKSKYIPLDLSANNPELQDVDVSALSQFSKFIDVYLKAHDALVAYGGYNEVRTLYNQNSHFKSGLSEHRNIHIGMDFWCDAETPIYAPLDAEVHSFKNNANDGDYGPTIILKHIIKGITFYTLYGHLSLNSIEQLKTGQKFKKGDAIGSLGTPEVNGGYAPHLHFQIIKDLQGNFGDYPGVCSKADLVFYLGNCPDPRDLLGI